jgi:peptidoglycan/LPS O-acetylase OafA/YrhL
LNTTENLSKTSKPNSRIGMVDIYRLLFIFLIMKHHLYIPGGHFQSAWIYVEFFFILTGYFTALHFDKLFHTNQFSSISDKQKYVLSYSFHKFKNFIPYILIAVIFEYSLSVLSVLPQGKRALLTLFENFVCEITLLSSSGLSSADLAPIWYLSAMFLVFPLFALILSSDKLHIICYRYLSWIIPVLYYGVTGITSRPYPDYLRAFSCMFLGVFVYEVTKKIAQRKDSVSFHIIVTASEFIAVLITIICTYFNTNNNKLILFAFVVATACTMSQKSYSKFVKCPVWFGELSLILFLIHWPVRNLIQLFGINFESRMDMILYYLLSIIVSLLIFVLVSYFKSLWKTKKTKQCQSIAK